MRNLNTENCINGIYATLKTELDFLVNNTIGSSQTHFESLREDFAKYHEVIFRYIAELDSVAATSKLPDVPQRGGSGGYHS